MPKAFISSSTNMNLVNMTFPQNQNLRSTRTSLNLLYVSRLHDFSNKVATYSKSQMHQPAYEWLIRFIALINYFKVIFRGIIMLFHPYSFYICFYRHLNIWNVFSLIIKSFSSFLSRLSVDNLYKYLLHFQPSFCTWHFQAVLGCF